MSRTPDTEQMPPAIFPPGKQPSDNYKKDINAMQKYSTLSQVRSNMFALTLKKIENISPVFQSTCRNTLESLLIKRGNILGNIRLKFVLFLEHFSFSQTSIGVSFKLKHGKSLVLHLRIFFSHGCPTSALYFRGILYEPLGQCIYQENTSDK